jgi:hypothetical protein
MIIQRSMWVGYLVAKSARCRAVHQSSVIGTNSGIQGLGTNPAALGSAGRDVASGYVLQERGRSNVYLSGST